MGPASERSNSAGKELRLRTAPVRRSHVGLISGIASCNLRSIERSTCTTITAVDNRHLRAAYFIVTGSPDATLKAKEALETLASQIREGGVPPPLSLPVTLPEPALAPTRVRATARLPDALELIIGNWLKRKVDAALRKSELSSELVKDDVGWAVHIYGSDGVATRQTAAVLEALFATLAAPPAVSQLSKLIQTMPAELGPAPIATPTDEGTSTSGPANVLTPPDLDAIRALAESTDPATLLYLTAHAVSENAVTPPDDLTEWAVTIATRNCLSVHGLRKVLVTMVARGANPWANLKSSSQ